MANEPQAYPKWLYHRRLAPQGKVFQTAAETEGLAAAGWVDTPAKFPKRSELSLSELREDFEAAEEYYRAWTAGGASEPGSERWEGATAAYNAARDSYQFAIREAELASGQEKAADRSRKKRAQTFETAFSVFTVEGTLGEGGNGTVFDVRDDDGAPWAIKCMKPGAISRQKLKRFKNEIAFCASVKHPNIVSVEDWGLAHVSGAAVPFFVMPRYPSTLRQHMRGGIASQAVLPWFEQILAGLEAAHAGGVWHRDLKPENLLCDPSTGQLVIADFGIAHFAESHLHTTIETATADRLANFQYAAPEQRAFGTVDYRADIYALGLILNELFTGEILQGTRPKTIASVAPEFGFLDDLVERMVRQSPEERPQSIREIRDAIPQHARVVAAAASSAGTGSTTMRPEPDTNVELARTPHGDSPKPSRERHSEVFERLRVRIFEDADSRYPEAAFLEPHQLAREFGLQVGYVHEFLEELHRDGYISISKWGSNRELSLDEWPSSAFFFDYSADGGSVRVRMKRLGKQALLDANARK